MVKVKCEVWSRVVGYLRPVESWNKGKQAEYKKRKTFNPEKSLSKQPEKIKQKLSKKTQEQTEKVEKQQEQIKKLEIKQAA